MLTLNSKAIAIRASADTIEEVLLEKMYPVGSVYISMGQDPNTLFGGTWERLATGVTLWSASAGYGEEIEAGLPNITGKATTARMNTGFGNLASSGAIYGESNSTSNCIGWISEGNNQSFCFDASRSNEIYGKSPTVQPPAIKVAMWQRTA